MPMLPAPFSEDMCMCLYQNTGYSKPSEIARIHVENDDNTLALGTTDSSLGPQARLDKEVRWFAMERIPGPRT